jgi:ATP-dependent Lhr-like helicase
MFEILYDNIQYDFLDQASNEEIDIMRKDFAMYCIQHLSTQRPVIINKMTIELYSFTGTKINRTIEFLLNILGFKISRDNEMSIIMDFNETELKKKKFLFKWNNLPFLLSEIDLHITSHFRENPSLLSFSKWGSYLPESYQIELIKNTYFDIEGTKNYLETTQLIFNQ